MEPHDPTRIAPAPVHTGKGAVVLSLSETHALCAKAARGAGFDWGHADEAGHAAAWLAARNLPGCALILRRLQMRAPAAMSAAAGQCPLLTGVALADNVNLSEARRDDVHLINIVLPGLLLPFAALAARLRGSNVSVGAHGLKLTLHADGTAPCFDAMSAFCDRSSGDISLAFGPQQARRPQRSDVPAQLPSVPVEIWRALDALALHVTVPPSDHSRSGAGGEGSDND